jgi:hypothetical protein
VKPGRSWHEPPVEVHHSQEVLHLLDGGGRRVVRDGLDPPRERLDAAGSDTVSQEIQLGLPELPSVGCQAGPLQPLQDQHQVGPVLLLPFGEDEDVVQVGEGALDAGQDAVHQALEGVARVPHAKGHPCKLKSRTAW